MTSVDRCKMNCIKHGLKKNTDAHSFSFILFFLVTNFLIWDDLDKFLIHAWVIFVFKYLD